jgi:flagellar biosynthesis protein FliP
MVPPVIPTSRYAQPSDNIFTDKSVSIFLLNTISFSDSPANNVNQQFMWFLSELLMHPKLIVHPLYLQHYETHRHNIEMYGKTLKHYIFRNEDDKQIAQWIKIIPSYYQQKELHALARK